MNRVIKIEKACLKIIRACFFMALISPLLMFYNMYFPYTTVKALVFYLAVEIMFLTWLFLNAITNKYRLKIKNPIVISILAYFLILIISTILSVNPVNSFWSNFVRMGGLLMWIHLIAFFITITSVLKNNEWVKYIISSITVSTIGSIMFWLNFFKIEELPKYNQGSFAGNSSVLASYLIINIFLAIYCYFKNKSPEDNSYYRAISIMGIFILIPTLLTNDGRAGTIAFLINIILIMLLWLSFEFRKKTFQKTARITLSLFIIFLFLIIFFLHHNDNIIQKTFDGLTNGARRIVWGQALEASRERPLLGWGPENLIISSNKYFNPYLVNTGELGFDRAHNVIYDTLIESGILGLISYLSIFIVTISILTVYYFRNKISFMLWVAPITILLSNFLINLSVFDTTMSFIVLILLLAWVSSIIRQPKTDYRYYNIRPIKLIILIIILFITFITSLNYFVIKPLYKNYLIMQAYNLHNLNQKELNTLEKNYFKTSLINQGEIESFVINEFLAHIQPGEDISEDRLIFWETELENMIKHNPLNYYNYIRLGETYNIHGRLTNDPKIVAKGEELLESAISLSPSNPSAYWILIKSKTLLEKPKEAIALANTVIKINPTLTESYMYSVNLGRLLKDDNFINKQLQKAKNNNVDMPQLEEYQNILDL